MHIPPSGSVTPTDLPMLLARRSELGRRIVQISTQNARNRAMGAKCKADVETQLRIDAELREVKARIAEVAVVEHIRDEEMGGIKGKMRAAFAVCRAARRLVLDGDNLGPLREALAAMESAYPDWHRETLRAIDPTPAAPAPVDRPPSRAPIGMDAAAVESAYEWIGSRRAAFAVADVKARAGGEQRVAMAALRRALAGGVVVRLDHGLYGRPGLAAAFHADTD